MNLNESVFTIPVKEAVAYTKAWRDAEHANPMYAKAFTVKIQELEDLLAELKNIPNANAVRIYLAIKPNPNGTGDIETCILCGVTSFDPDKGVNGSDIVSYNVPGVNGETEVSGCYDFNFPCPTTCDEDSPLLTGKI